MNGCARPRPFSCSLSRSSADVLCAAWCVVLRFVLFCSVLQGAQVPIMVEMIGSRIYIWRSGACSFSLRVLRVTWRVRLTAYLLLCPCGAWLCVWCVLVVRLCASASRLRFLALQRSAWNSGLPPPEPHPLPQLLICNQACSSSRSRTMCSAAAPGVRARVSAVCLCQLFCLLVWSASGLASGLGGLGFGRGFWLGCL